MEEGHRAAEEPATTLKVSVWCVLRCDYSRVALFARLAMLEVGVSLRYAEFRGWFTQKSLQIFVQQGPAWALPPCMHAYRTGFGACNGMTSLLHFVDSPQRPEPALRKHGIDCQQ